MDNRKDRKKIESILREPLTRNRFFLNSKLRAAQNPEDPQPFALEDLKKFIAGIRINTEDFNQEVLNVIEAVQTGKAPQTPSFDTPETQLIWGAALAYLTLNPQVTAAWVPPVTEEQTLADSELWKQITTTSTAYRELATHAHHVRESLRDTSIKHGWSAPGTGFTFDRKKNIINIDLMQSMIVGFEHARADVYREVGHSLLSVTYPKRMQEVYKEMLPYMRKAQLAEAKKGPKLKPDEYKKLLMLNTEWKLRHMMFAAAEENVANRFVTNMGQESLQDYGVSLNHTAVTHRAVGLTRLPGDKNASEELRRYMNLCNAVQLSFFANNGLFDDTDDGWAKVGVDPGMVRKSATLAARPEGAKEDKDGISHPDFKRLRELCGGPQGLENLQPKQQERLYGWNNLIGRVQRADLGRKAIIDEIWKLYAEDLIKKILEMANDQIDQQLKEAKEKQKEQGQDGEDQDGEEQEGEEQEGQGQGQGKGKKGKGKGKKQRGQPQGDPQDGDDSDDGEEADGDEQDGEEQDGQENKDGKGKKKKDQKDKKDKKDGKGDKGEKGEEGEEGDEQGKGAEGELGADGEKTVPVEGAGDMPAPEGATEVPADELSPDGEGQEADGEDADGEGDGRTLEELEKEAEKAEEGEDADGEDADGEDADGEGQGKKQKAGQGKKGHQAGQGDGKKLGDLANQDWTKYNERIAELADPISRVRKLFKDIQDRQLQRKRGQSRSLDILPENGEVKERFNTEAHRNLVIKKATGQVEKQDMERFHKDETKFVPTEIDLVIMIDGSGSMNGTPLNSALQAAAIMFEAASGKDMKMNVYVGMWGDKDPPMLIFPGADRVEIGKQMERARKGLNSGTDLAPAIKKVAQTIGDQQGRSGTLSGFTHVLIISDGDMFDIAPAKERMLTMFESSDKVTFDVAIIGRQGTSMETMAKGIKGSKPFQDIGVAVGNDPNTIPMEIVGLLLEKVRKCGSFTAVPNSQKRRAMRKAHNKMDPKR